MTARELFMESSTLKHKKVLIPAMSDIENAVDRIKPYVHYTPVLTCKALNRLSGAELFFKCENFQKTGSFKIRGATNAVFSISAEEASRGVATHSSGNHGAALAQAAQWRNTSAYVVMPENASVVKKEAVAAYGAEIIYCGSSLEAREEGLKQVVEHNGCAVIHSYNDYRIIVGQGTAALELCSEIQDLNALITPVGGGGLLSGTAITVAHYSPATEVFGAEPEMADDACRSLKSGKIIPSHYPATVADGLRTSLGDLTFPILTRYVKEIITVSESKIIEAMHLIWERMKIIVEPSAAVPLGAILLKKSEYSGKRVGIILSGGNVDLANLPW